MNTSEIIAQHEASGNYLQVKDLRTFYLDRGKGEAVVCLHGVPSSSYLYRKIIPVLAESGLRGISFDFPGMGLSDKPEKFDYSWYGLADFAQDFIAALGLKKYHLVIHDVGGPVGLLLASKEGDKIQSITVLNTVVEVANFHRPWSMYPFTIPWVGEAWLASLNHLTAYVLFSLQAVQDLSAIPRQEIYAYVDLLKRKDNGKAFLKIMRSFNLDQATEDIIVKTLSSAKKVQAIWGRNDPALSVKKYGAAVKRIAHLSSFNEISGKHFFQEDQWQSISSLIVDFIKGGK